MLQKEHIKHIKKIRKQFFKISKLNDPHYSDREKVGRLNYIERTEVDHQVQEEIKKLQVMLYEYRNKLYQEYKRKEQEYIDSLTNLDEE